MARRVVRSAFPFLLVLSLATHAALPGAPSGVVALARNASAVVHVSPPSSDGGQTITGYTVTASPGGATATSASLPITVTGLVNGSSYTFTARAINASGLGPSSAPSNAAWPIAGTVPVDVATVESFGLALDAHGQVYAWGSDSYGELGQARSIVQPAPVPVPGLPPIKQVALFDQVLALDNSGQVWSWGDGVCTHLGPRDSGNGAKAARLIGATGFTQVAAGWCVSYGLKADGSVWKLQSSGNVNLAFPSGIVEISARGGHLLARRNDNTLWATGDNSRGQLGQGHANPVAGVVQVPGLNNVAAISAGLFDSAARLATGEVRYWGELNQVAGGTLVTTPTPFTGLGGTATSVACDFFGCAVVRSDGTVWIYNGSLSAPTQVSGMTGIARAAYNTWGTTLGLTTAGAVLASGSNQKGQLGQGTTAPVAGTVAVPGFASNTLQLLVGRFDETVIALKSDGTVWVWGANPAGQRGDGAATGSSMPLAVPVPRTVTAIASSQRSAYAVDDETSLWGWGDNSAFALDPSGVSRSTPTKLADKIGATAIRASFFGNLAFLKADGTAWVRSNAANTQVALPVKAADLAVAVGPSYFFLGDEGSIYSFGENLMGQLGNGTTAAAQAPVKMALPSKATKVVANWFQVAALGTDRRIYVWGSDAAGRGMTAGTLRPVAIPGVADAVDIALDTRGGIFRRLDGSTARWAYDFNTQAYSTVALAGAPANQRFATTFRSDHFIGPTGLLWGQGFNSPGTIDITVGDGTYVARSTAVPLLAHAGTGSVDAANWYLDLQPATAETLAPSLVPKALASARSSGNAASLGVDGVVRYRDADLGKQVNHYVLAVVPPAFFTQVKRAATLSPPEALRAKAAKAGGYLLAQLTPAGWVDVNGQLLAYSQGVANASGGAASILNGVSTALLAGSRFCIGYGESADAMLSSQSLREVVLLEGAASTVSGVPCVLSGVYVDGPASSIQGSAVTFNASVVGLDPTGTVTFLDGFGTMGSAAIAPANAAVSKASIATSSLAAGAHAIGASYTGDPQNLATATTIPVLHTVIAPQATARTDLSGPVGSTLNAEVVFTATITGRNPTGSVQFRDGATIIGTVPLVNGIASLRIATLALGVHSIAADYPGDINNLPGTSPTLSHLVVESTATQAILSASAAQPTIGTPVTLTATVVGTNPTGSVSFRDNAAVFATVPLANGQAQFTTNGFAAGSHLVTADYSGDANNPRVSSATVVVEIEMKLDPAQGALDSDGDGMSNAVEAAEGRNPFTKDNDVFANGRLFAMQQYRDFLAREGDAGGVNFWASQVSGGSLSRGQAIESFFSSPEFQGTIAPVARLYFAYFLRVPDYPGLNFWIGQYRGGMPLITVSQNFAASAEFGSRYGALNNGQFVDLVYQNVLGRAPDAGGKAFWQGQLDTGAMNRGQVMVGFSESDEYKLAINSEVYVTMMYNGMLRRAPDSSGFSFWVQYLDAGNSGLALINGFLVSPEYRARFLP